jgi:hypothetical protein
MQEALWAAEAAHWTVEEDDPASTTEGVEDRPGRAADSHNKTSDCEEAATSQKN